MHDPPTEATSQQPFLEDRDRQVADAHEAGTYTAVLKLAQRRRGELVREFATLTAGHELRRFSNRELDELRRQWTPEKARLNEQVRELDWKIRQWDYVARDASMPAANEAHGWTIQPDGSYAKELSNGRVLSAFGGISYEEDGEIVDTSKRSDEWHRRHKRHLQDFGHRVRTKRLEKVRSRTRPAPQRRAREHRPAAARRAASSSTTSSSDPGDPDPAEPAVIRVRRPSGRLDTFLADSIERGDGILWATGRWRDGRAGVYGFTAPQIVEVRA